MGKFIREANSFAKGFLLFSRVGYLLLPFQSLLRFAANFSLLTRWVGKHRKTTAFSDYYRPVRKYADRLKLYAHASGLAGLDAAKITYLEFGVASAASFRWWLANNANPESAFFGFDTFEGLPESWFIFKKGAMSFQQPDIADPRAAFYKGLFQETLFRFLAEHPQHGATQKVIHMDADLYSSTLFVLSSLAPYLRVGDILFFDEFNVPNHEFAAWHDYIRSFYIEYEVLGGVNNFYATCFRITKVPWRVERALPKASGG